MYRVWKTKHQFGEVDYIINVQNDLQKQHRMEGFEHLFPTDPVSLKIVPEKR